MAKMFGLLLIVLGVWVGMEIYTKGMDQAFGGALAGFAEPSESAEAPRGSLMERARSTVESSMQQTEDAAERAGSTPGGEAGGDEDDD